MRVCVLGVGGAEEGTVDGAEDWDGDIEEGDLKTFVLPWVAMVSRVPGSRVREREMVSPASRPPP